MTSSMDSVYHIHQGLSLLSCRKFHHFWNKYEQSLYVCLLLIYVTLTDPFLRTFLRLPFNPTKPLEANLPQAHIFPVSFLD